MSKILLVEDDFAISLLYKTKLEIHDWLVDVAHNGLEALKQVAKNSYDIILLDLKMPYMDGEEFLRRFRKEQKDENTPVIILTNISREEAPKTLWHYGISGYFVKAHSTPKDLAEIVAKHLNK